MVVLAGMKSQKIGKKTLLKSLSSLSLSLFDELKIDKQDIGLIIHCGTYRKQFRTEPAFACHLQNKIQVRTNELTIDSMQCFSFDIKDGNCGPHQALHTIAKLLPSIGCKYALLSVGDQRPNRASEWSYQPTSFVAVCSLEGDGPRILSANFETDEQNFEHKAVAKFNSNINRHILDESEFLAAASKSNEHMFIGSNEWLGGEQLMRFFEWAKTRKGDLSHRIIDSNNRVSTILWRCGNGTNR